MTERKQEEKTLVQAQKHAESIVKTIREPLLVLTADLKVISANRSFYQTFKVSPEETEGQFIYDLGSRQWDIPALRKLLEEIVPQNTQFNDFQVDHEFPAIGRRTMLLNARRIYREGGGTETILLALEDITDRKRSEEALKVSETRYQRLFETTQDGILILDADTGQISDVNPFLVEMLGYCHGDVLGKKLWEIGAFKDIEASKAAFSELQNKGYVRYEDLPLGTRDGRNIDVEFVGNVYLVDHKKVIQCNIRDITQRKQAKDELSRKTHELGERVKELNCFYAYSKLIENPDICLPEIFQGLVDLIPSGWQHPEITCARLVLEDQVFRTANFMETIWKQSSPILVDGRHIGDLEVYYLEERPEGDEGPFLKGERDLIGGLASRLGKTIQRKRTEETLRESEERFRLAINATNDGLWEWDIQTGQEFFSPRWCEIIGYSSDDPELLHTYNSWASRIHPDDYDRVISALNNHLEKGTIYDVDYRHRHKSGEYRWQNSRGQAILNEGGKPTKMVGCISDINERKQAEERLQKAHDELEQRVEERTADLTSANKQLYQRIEERKHAEESLQNALSEIKILKDQLEAENIYFRQEIKMKHQFDDIIGQSNAFKYVLFRAEQVASTNATVLLLGETGTGKELIAAAIHQMSPRKDRPLLTINCAAMPANLIENELFGREKGAYTGADARQIGRFEVANGSTLCLDEIGELPLDLQPKLLRVIEHGEFQRLGSSHTIKVDVRIVATTNRNLEEEVRKGRFRQDLYYRLNGFPLTLPPLRQRKEDIPLLVQTFVERYAKKLGKQFTSIHKDTMKALQDYPWPGNIRELENVIERAVILCPGPVLQLAERLENSSALLSSSTVRTLEETEREHILKALSETRWRINGKRGTAAILGLHPSTLRSRMRKLGIHRPGPKASD